jgi:hypothetical protein
LIAAVMTVGVMVTCPTAQARPSQTGPDVSGMVRDSHGKTAPSKAGSNGGNNSEVWTWPIVKEPQSRVWTDARGTRSTEVRSQVSNKGQTAEQRSASLKSVFLGGL